MTTQASRSLIVVSLVAVVGTCTEAVGQEPPSGSRVAVLDTPHALRMAHKYLLEDLARALEDTAGVGDVAREIDRVLPAHLKREEAMALQPLGLLRGLARDATSADITRVVAMAVEIERDLPGLLEEHRTIAEKSQRLADVARRERKPQYAGLVERLWLHARIDEEVLYPSAILLGEYLKVTHAAQRSPRGAKP